MCEELLRLGTDVHVSRQELDVTRQEGDQDENLQEPNNYAEVVVVQM